MTIALSPETLSDDIADWERWAKQAIALGANALMMRSASLGRSRATAIALRLKELGVPLLANVPPQTLPLPVHGLHLKANDPRLPQDLQNYPLLGKSCHSLAEVLAAERAGFHYVFLSPVFATASHPQTPPLGLAYLQAVCQQTSIAVYALGGVTADRAPLCIAAGAAGVAGIGLFAPPNEPNK